MKIIDCAIKGNVFRLFLRPDEPKGINEILFDVNNSRDFIEITVDYAAPYDWGIYIPEVDAFHSNWSANDIKTQRVPCVVVVNGTENKDCWKFEQALAARSSKKFYLNDEYNPEDFKGLIQLTPAPIERRIEVREKNYEDIAI